jgi:hypothetical protein
VPAPGYQQPQQFQPQQFQLPQPPPAQPLQWGQPHQPRPCIIQGPMTC